MKKYLIPLTLSLLLASCGGTSSESSPNVSEPSFPSSSEVVDEAPFQAFLNNAKSNVGRIQTFLEDNGEYKDYIAFDFYSDTCAYQTNGEYLKEIYDSYYGETLTDQGVMVYADQGLFSYYLGEDGSFTLGDPLGVGTTLKDADIHLLEELADENLYSRGKDSLSYSSKMEKNVPLAASAWFSVMGVELDDSSTVTKANFALNEEGTSVTAVFTILEQESGNPITTKMKAELTLLGSLEAKGELKEAITNPTPLPIPSTWGETASNFLSSVPGQENALPFPSVSTVQYKELLRYGVLQISVDGVNLYSDYVTLLTANGFTMKRESTSTGFSTYYVHEAKGGEGDTYRESSLRVQISYVSGCSYILVTPSVTYKGVGEVNAFFTSWNEGIYNTSHNLGCPLPLLPSSSAISGVRYEDDTEYQNDYYLSNGVNPYLLAAYVVVLEIEDVSEAGNFVSSYLASLTEAGYADLGELSLANDNEVGYSYSSSTSSYGIGVNVEMTQGNDGYAGTVVLRVYCSVPEYVAIFVNN